MKASPVISIRLSSCVSHDIADEEVGPVKLPKFELPPPFSTFRRWLQQQNLPACETPRYSTLLFVVAVGSVTGQKAPYLNLA